MIIRKNLRIAFIISIVIFIVFIIIWRLDRTFFYPYIPHYFDQIRSDVTTLKFTIPKSKESCEEKGGVWKKLGPRPMEECNLPTTDGGKICSGSKECEGVCLAETNAEDVKKGMRGKMIKTKGTCSQWVKVLGCRWYVYQGWASMICAD